MNYLETLSITRASQKLRLRILAEQNQDIPIRTCKSRIYAALNYFNVDNNVPVKIWENDFADKYQDLALMAIEMDDLRTAKQCYDAARAARIAASEATAREADWAPVFIISPDITPEQMGFETQSLKEIARKSNDGFYIKLISELKVDESERKRLLRDADIQDVDFEELNPSQDD